MRLLVREQAVLLSSDHIMTVLAVGTKGTDNDEKIEDDRRA
jgi:hypothetical protein